MSTTLVVTEEPVAEHCWATIVPVPLDIQEPTVKVGNALSFLNKNYVYYIEQPEIIFSIITMLQNIEVTLTWQIMLCDINIYVIHFRWDSLWTWQSLSTWRNL